MVTRRRSSSESIGRQSRAFRYSPLLFQGRSPKRSATKSSRVCEVVSARIKKRGRVPALERSNEKRGFICTSFFSRASRTKDGSSLAFDFQRGGNEVV